LWARVRAGSRARLPGQCSTRFLHWADNALVFNVSNADYTGKRIGSCLPTILDF